MSAATRPRSDHRPVTSGPSWGPDGLTAGDDPRHNHKEQHHEH